MPSVVEMESQITNALGGPRGEESQSPRHLIWGIGNILSSWDVDVVENKVGFEEFRILWCFHLEFKLEMVRAQEIFTCIFFRV